MYGYRVLNHFEKMSLLITRSWFHKTPDDSTSSWSSDYYKKLSLAENEQAIKEDIGATESYSSTIKDTVTDAMTMTNTTR